MPFWKKPPGKVTVQETPVNLTGTTMLQHDADIPAAVSTGVLMTVETFDMRSQAELTSLHVTLHQSSLTVRHNSTMCLTDLV